MSRSLCLQYGYHNQHGHNTIQLKHDLILTSSPIGSILLLNSCSKHSRRLDRQSSLRISKNYLKITIINWTHLQPNTDERFPIYEHFWSFKPQRRPTLMNAIVHHKAQELNKGGYSSPLFFCLIPVAGAQTSKANIQQIHKAVKRDPALNPNTMSEEKRKS